MSSEGDHQVPPLLVDSHVRTSTLLERSLGIALEFELQSAVVLVLVFGGEVE